MSQDNGHDEVAAAARFAERGVAERGESSRGARGASGAPDRELVERPKRRRFTAKYKLEILEKADACTRPGEVGELLRREGLYTSHLTYWRKQRRDGALRELGQTRGRKPTDRRDGEIAELRSRAERAEVDAEAVELQVHLGDAAGALALHRHHGAGGERHQLVDAVDLLPGLGDVVRRALEAARDLCWEAESAVFLDLCTAALASRKGGAAALRPPALREPALRS